MEAISKFFILLCILAGFSGYAVSVEVAALLDSMLTVEKWTTYDKDKDGNTWEISSSSKSMIVTTAGKANEQENWLISPYIPLNEAKEIAVRIQMNLQMCNYTSDKINFDNCKISLDLQLKQASTSLTDINQYVDSFEKQTDIVPAKYNDATQVDTMKIKLSSGTKGIYMALVDRGTNVTVTQIQVLYRYCGTLVTNLVTFNSSVPSSARITGTCVDNSAPKGSLDRTCEEDGNWGSFNGECTCHSGYSPAYNKESCISKECTSSSCLNGGTCLNTQDGFSCSCPTDFLGSQCHFDQNGPPGKPVITGYDEKGLRCVRPGSKLILNCTSVGGLRTIDLKWYLDGKDIEYVTVYQKSPTAPTYQQEARIETKEIVVNAELHHNSTFECRASSENQLNPLFANVTLHVCFGPAESSVHAIIDKIDTSKEEVTVICYANDTYPIEMLSFNWAYQIGEDLTSVPGKRTQTDVGQISVLVADTSEIAENGIFVCIVKSAATNLEARESVAFSSFAIETSTSSAGLIVGIVAAVVAVVIIIAIGCTVYKKKTTKPKHADVKYQHSVPRTDPEKEKSQA